MRVRIIRPAYWTDADLHRRLSADVREFYIGLWMLADDAGYVPWDPDRIGAELYPYREPAGRSELVQGWAEELGDHAQILECGRHLLVPNLPVYQQPSRPSYATQRAHDACLREQRAPSGASGAQMGADGASARRRVEKSREEKRGVELSRSAPAGARPSGSSEESEFRRKVAAAGGPER